jgi:hypothetical protein
LALLRVVRQHHSMLTIWIVCHRVRGFHGSSPIPW